MNKTELVANIVGSTGLSKKDVGITLDATLDAITKALASGDKVSLIGFGNFEVRDRAARQGRNPQDGTPISIAASKAPAFKAGSKLKEAVKQ